MSLALGVCASGLLTAVGYNAPASLAALRAGVSGVRAQAGAQRESGEPHRCARISLPQRWEGAALLADLLAPAVHECRQAVPELPLRELPLLVGVAHPLRPGRPAALEDRLPGLLAERLGEPLCRDSQVFAGGQAGCAEAVLQAQALIAAGRARCVIVAGVDSLVDRPTLEAMEARRRLLTKANFNGFLAGEAGAAVLLSRADAPLARLRIIGAGRALEPGGIESTQPTRGEGLTRALRAALEDAGVSMTEIGFRLSDLSGEHYKFKEAMFAAMRLDPRPRAEPLPMWHPIEYLGEIGAAVLPCLLAWADHAMRQGYADGPRALCHVGSDPGERAAFVLEGRMET